jgi:hypothetical protein
MGLHRILKGVQVSGVCASEGAHVCVGAQVSRGPQVRGCTGEGGAQVKGMHR